jgi:uncharacterized protein (TIGR02246 family)
MLIARNKAYIPLAGVALAGLVALTGTWPSARTTRAAPPGQAHEADRQAIEKSARLFMQAFDHGDAAAVASLWTAQGEMRDPGGRVIQGRKDIEAAFRALFKEQPKATIEVLVKSIRFPAKDLAVEEGLLRLSHGGKDMPTTTSYVVVHAREGGQWKIALSSEAGSGQDRLEDLGWLLGEWTGKAPEGTVRLSFARDPKKPIITATISRVSGGKDPVTRTIRIAVDPETGRIRSWSFEDDGGHAQAVWVNDGKSWILDSRGVLADGTPTAERIVLRRVGADAISWRAIDRVLGETPQADTPPMRLTRANGSR